MAARTTTTQLQPDSHPSLILRQEAAASGPNLSEYDEEQARLMEERCILVTPDDVAYGEDSKKTCKRSPSQRTLECELIDRPLDDQHQRWTTTSCIFSILVPTFRRTIVVAKEGR